MRNMNVLIMTTVAFVGVTLSGCDQPVYEGAGEPPPPAAESEPILSQQPNPDAAGERRESTSTYGKAMDAGRRTVDRLEEHDRRILEEIPDY